MDEKLEKKRQRLRKLQQKFSAEVEQKIADLVPLWQTAKVESHRDNRREFFRLVHSLAGSAPTFGFSRLGKRCRDLEYILALEGENPLTEDLISKVDSALGELAHDARQGPDSDKQETLPSVSRPHSVVQPLVFMLEDDVDLATETTLQLQHFGYRVETFYDSDTMLEAGKSHMPDAMVVDIRMPEGSLSGTEAVSALQKFTESPIPVVFMSGYDTWQNRLNAVRAGGRAYIRKPLNFNEMVEQLDHVTGRRSENQYRVIIVDDSVLLAEHYATVLQAANMETQIVHDAADILNVLPVFSPDLILMDIYMPSCNGVEAATVIRQHAGYTNLPIVYLSTESGLAKQLEALRVGGDDFLHKPIDDAHLVSAVAIRARRFRDLSALMNKDSLTGLLNHINLKLILEREVAQSLRQGNQLSFVMIDIDHFKDINDHHGHPEGDRVIKTLARLLTHRLRKVDVAARYGGEEFAVVLPITPPEQAFKVIEDIRASFAEVTFTHASGDYNATFSAGIAACPTVSTMAELIVAADQALYRAKSSGRNCTVVSSERD